MKLAIMQPYFLPYVGYFQLIAAVDKFVFLDDVHFINRGWINRNHIALQGVKHLFTIPLIGASQNRLIHEIEVDADPRWRHKLLLTVERAYRKAPCFGDVFAGLKALLTPEPVTIGDLAKRSIRWVNERLGLATPTVDSSGIYGNAHLKGAERIRDICLRERATIYVNPPGGRELYETSFFAERQLELRFLEPALDAYPQYDGEFLPGLSVLDLLMHLPPELAIQWVRRGALGAPDDAAVSPAASANQPPEVEAV
ncbi:MAG TPA: WbqC family protein [Pirellulaceae bacterium]|nr:WbqC family protein [Pirellulaceae bacterium]